MFKMNSLLLSRSNIQITTFSNYCLKSSPPKTLNSFHLILLFIQSPLLPSSSNSQTKPKRRNMVLVVKIEISLKIDNYLQRSFLFFFHSCNIHYNINKMSSVSKSCCTTYDAPLQMIYSDIWGSAPLPSTNNSRPDITFILIFIVVFFPNILGYIYIAK